MKKHSLSGEVNFVASCETKT